MEEWEKLLRHEEPADSLALASDTLEFLGAQGIASIGDLLDADRSFFPTAIADDVQRVLLREELIEPSAPEPDYDAERRAKRKKRTPVERLVVAIDRGDRVLYDDDEPGYWEHELLDFESAHCDAALRELRRGLQLDKGGKHLRRLHAIVWLGGIDAPEVRTLLDEPTRNTRPMLQVLTSRHRTLPEWMLRPLVASWNEKKDARVARALCRIASPAVVPMLFGAIHAQARVMMDEIASGCPAFHACEAMPDGVLERHRELVDALLEVNHRYPNHWALFELDVMSRLAGEHAEVATRNAELLIEMWHTRSTPGDPGRPPSGLLRHVETNAALLSEQLRAKVAALLLGEEPSLFRVAAAAWIQLDDVLELAHEVAKRTSDAAIETGRWHAMADRAAEDDRVALHDFFHDRVDECAAHLRLAVLSAIGKRPVERMEELVQRAFDVKELEVIARVASKREVDVLRPVLMRFREPKMTPSPEIISVLRRQMTSEHEEWLAEELDEHLPAARRTLSQLLR